MKILLTGGSSFTGFWFAKELAEAGHEVFCTFTQGSDAYSGVRNERVQALLDKVQPIYETQLGSDSFLELIRKEKFDLFCSHGAYMVDYRSPDFDYATAFQRDTHQLSAILKSLNAGVVFTGTVFEPGEGAGSDDLRAVSPYGATKRSVYEMYRVFAELHGLPLAKFVIPNPFGTYEDPKLPAYLMKSWRKGEVPEIKTPAYIRDNIHVSLLAKAYVRFCEEAAASRNNLRTNPSQYIESQGQFVLRFATEMRKRIRWKCDFVLNHQIEFPEPRIRVNTDPAIAGLEDWDESLAWDEIAQFYDSRADN